jgi:hypothetical protein
MYPARVNLIGHINSPISVHAEVTKPEYLMTEERNRARHFLRSLKCCETNGLGDKVMHSLVSCSKCYQAVIILILTKVMLNSWQLVSYSVVSGYG